MSFSRSVKSVGRSGILALASGLLAVCPMAIGPAEAQYRGAYNYGYDLDGGPGYGYGYYRGTPYQPYYYPDQGRGAYARGYNEGYDQSPYADPYSRGPRARDTYNRDSYNRDAYNPDPRSSDRGPRPGGGYDLGANANRTTREEIPNPTRQPPGTIVIDTASRHLYYTEANGQALRYGIGVGRQGFAWKGVAKVERKAEWPDWIPPADMLKRRPDLPTRMAGGIENPLGARALYLFQGNRDTLFRIHGTNEPDTIGKAVSSGCIRMMNADVIDLFQRVPVGTKVVVL